MQRQKKYRYCKFAGCKQRGSLQQSALHLSHACACAINTLITSVQQLLSCRWTITFRKASATAAASGSSEKQHRSKQEHTHTRVFIVRVRILRLSRSLALLIVLSSQYSAFLLLLLLIRKELPPVWNAATTSKFVGYKYLSLRPASAAKASKWI